MEEYLEGADSWEEAGTSFHDKKWWSQICVKTGAQG